MRDFDDPQKQTLSVLSKASWTVFGKVRIIHCTRMRPPMAPCIVVARPCKSLISPLSYNVRWPGSKCSRLSLVMKPLARCIYNLSRRALERPNPLYSPLYSTAMRAPFFFSVLAVLLLFAGVTSSSDNTPRARVADPPTPSKRSATVPSKSSALKYYKPRSKPSSVVGAKVLDRLANRAAPSQVHNAPRAIPSSKPPPARRSEQEQNVFGHDATYVPDLVSEKEYKQGCHDDACPVPLSACPVRDAHDTDAFECVDFWADLNSCGGCAAKDIS
jgi:hypothetical protein